MRSRLYGDNPHPPPPPPPERNTALKEIKIVRKFLRAAKWSKDLIQAIFNYNIC